MSRQTETPEKEQLRRRLARQAGLTGQLRRRWYLSFWRLGVFLAGSAKRLVDALFAAVLLALLSPLLLLVAVALLRRGGLLFARRTCLGKRGRIFDQYRFALGSGPVDRVLAACGVGHLPLLINVLKGDMSFVGPRAVGPGEMNLRRSQVRQRFEVRPGLLGLWWLRRRANIAYGSEVDTDLEYVEGHSLGGDLGIALRSLPASLYGDSGTVERSRISVLGIPVDNLTMDEALDEIMARLAGQSSTQLCFLNADCVNLACRDPHYRDTLCGADLSLADGIGLKLAGSLLGQPIRQNVNGTDLFPRLCARLENTGQGVFLLGGRPGVAEGVRDWIREHCPGVVVSGLHHGYFAAHEQTEVLRQVSSSGASLLLVAMGSPRQDNWIREHLAATGVRLAMGVGGLFDFYSGRIPRAPLWVREIAMEWFYRFMQEPGRMWKRYFLGNGLFLARVCLARCGRSYPRSSRQRGV